MGFTGRRRWAVVLADVKLQKMRNVLRLIVSWFVVLLCCSTCVAAQNPNGLIVLLNDYGSQDYYLGALKGSIYSKFPEARVDLITSEAPPMNVREASYLLAHAASEFPAGTVFCITTETESNGKSRAIAVQTEDGKFYVAPDNGTLTLVLRHSKLKKAHEIVNPEFLKDAHSLSFDFPGKDVYGPAAAGLAKGIALEAAGPAVKDPVMYRIIEPKLEPGELTGEVEHIDGSGRIFTNIPQELVEKFGVAPGKLLSINLGSEVLDAPFVKNYTDVSQGGWLVLINRSKVLEIARNQANANAFLQAHNGAVVRVRLYH